MATKLDYQDGYKGKPGRSTELEYIIGWLDRLWEQKGGKA